MTIWIVFMLWSLFHSRFHNKSEVGGQAEGDVVVGPGRALGQRLGRVERARCCRPGRVSLAPSSTHRVAPGVSREGSVRGR